MLAELLLMALLFGLAFKAGYDLHCWYRSWR